MSVDPRSNAELHHIGYVVLNMSRKIKQLEREGAKLTIGPTDDPLQRVTCALLQLADGTNIELVSPVDDEESPLSSRLRRGGGYDHLCFSVADVRAALDAEEEDGATIVCEPLHAVTFGETIGFVLRRSGMLIEYMSGGS